jgi:hypothetical protein
MAETYTFGKIGVEDIELGYGAFSAPTTLPDGTSVTLNKLGLHTLTSILNVKDFGAVGDGVNDDTTAIQAAINLAVTTARSVYIPGSLHEYLITGLTIPTDSDYKSLKIFGDGCTNGYLGGNEFGTRIKCIGSGDAISAISTAFGGRPQYSFEDFTLSGPDTYAPRTATSGNGFRFSGNSVPTVYMKNITVGMFYGSGKSGIWFDNVIGSTLINVRSEYNNINLKLTTYSNLFQGYNISLRYSASYALYIDGTDGGEFHGLIESNEKTGIRFAGGTSLNWNFYTWQEANNTSGTAGESGIVIKPDGAGFCIVRDIFFHNTRFNPAAGHYEREAPYLEGSDANHQVYGVQFIGGYWATISNPGPAITLVGNVQYTYLSTTDALLRTQIHEDSLGGFTPSGTVMETGNGSTKYGLKKLWIDIDPAVGDANADINTKGYWAVVDAAAVNDTAKSLLAGYIGADGVLNRLEVAVKATPSATGASRFLDINIADAVAHRPVRINGISANPNHIALLINSAALLGSNAYAVQINGGLLVEGASIKFNSSTIPVFASNALALAGGLVSGQLYKTGGNPDAICIVD